MKPLRLWARNLRTWDSLELDVPEGIAAVVGQNGAGKSTLVNVIDLSLFGTGREMKRALTRGAGEEEVEVGMELEHGGEVYRIRRSYNVRGRGKPRLDLERLGPDWYAEADEVGDPVQVQCQPEWESLTRETIEATQALLEDTLGLSRQTFRASAYLAQDDGAAFTLAEPRDRKAILLDALGVRVWDGLKTKTTAMRTLSERDLARLVGQVEQLEGRVAERDALAATVHAAAQEHEQLAYAVNDIGRGLEAARAELEEVLAQQAEAQSRREAATRLRQECSAAEERAATLTTKLSQLDGIEEKRTRITAIAKAKPLLVEWLELRRQAEETRHLAGRLEAEAERHRQEEGRQTQLADERIEALSVLEGELARILEGEATCPTCNQFLADTALEAAKASVQEKIAPLEQLRDQAFDTAVVAARLGHDVEVAHAELLAGLAERDKDNTRLSERIPEALRMRPETGLDEATRAEQALALMDQAERMAADDRAELARLQERLPFMSRQADNAEAAAVEMAGGNVDGKRSAIMGAEARLSDKIEERQAAAERLAAARTRLMQVEEDALELGVAAEARALKAERVALYKRAEQAFGRDGIPALILEAAALPQLESDSNRLIAEFGRPYRFELRTQKATQAGEVKEALDIVVMTDSGEALYEDFSGGERTRLDLALRIALARLLAARRGADVRLLAIDEPAYLDDEGFAQLATVLRGLAGEFESVLVVSHVDALRDAFDSAITVAGGADTGEPSRIEEA